jgi:hypothetical protein
VSGWADGHSLIIRGRTRAEVDDGVRMAMREEGTIAYRGTVEHTTVVVFEHEEQAARAFAAVMEGAMT